MTEYCKVQECVNAQMQDSYYCHAHRYEYEELKPKLDIQKTQVINDHIKVNIEQTAKGCRTTVTFDRSDHNIDEAVTKAVELFKKTTDELKKQGVKIDEC